MLKERGTKGEGEGEGRRSEKEWSVINLIKKLNARARRVVGKWIDHGLALGVLPCLASAGQKQQRKENGKWKERKKEEKERSMGGENGRRKKGQRQRKRRERRKVEKKERTEIDAYVGGYLRSGTCWQWYGRRYTWTIAGNRSFIDPSHLRQPGLYFPYIYIYIYTTRHVVSEARLLKKRRGLAHSWLLFPSLSLSLSSPTRWMHDYLHCFRIK